MQRTPMRQVAMWLPTEVVETLQTAAEQQCRTLSAYLRYLVIDGMRTGRTPSPPSGAPDSTAASPSSRQRRTSKKRQSAVSAAQSLAALQAFSLTPELLAWAEREQIPHPEHYLAEFRDYWVSVGCRRKNGVAIRDWSATYRNWLRRLKQEHRLVRHAATEFLARHRQHQEAV